LFVFAERGTNFTHPFLNLAVSTVVSYIYNLGINLFKLSCLRHLSYDCEFVIGLCRQTSGAGGSETDKSSKNKRKTLLKRSRGSLGSLDVVAAKSNKSPAKPSTSSSNEGSSQR